MGQSASNPAAAAPQAVVEVAETDREEELRRQRHQEEVMRLQRVVKFTLLPLQTMAGCANATAAARRTSKERGGHRVSVGGLCLPDWKVEITQMSPRHTRHAVF